MVNRLYNKQISPKGYDEGGQVKKISTINIPKGYHPMRGLEIEGRIRRGDTKKEIFSEHKKLKENLFWEKVSCVLSFLLKRRILSSLPQIEMSS